MQVGPVLVVVARHHAAVDLRWGHGGRAPRMSIRPTVVLAVCAVNGGFRDRAASVSCC